MRKGYFTQTELINLRLLTDKTTLDTKRLKDLIGNHKMSDYRKMIDKGIKYYNGEHDIKNFVRYYWVDQTKKEDQTRPNNKIQHQFHKILVDQKAGYLVGNPIAISLGEQDTNETDEKGKRKTTKEEQALMDVLGNKFDDIMNDWVIASSNQAVGWMHFYIDKDSNLRFMVCDGRELIPIYDTQYQKNLVGMIRYYEIEEVIENQHENLKLKSKRKMNVEWWTAKDVTYYTQLDNGDFVLDPDYGINPAGHFVTYNTINPETIFQGSWERVPFVPLLNNSEIKTDLEPIKALIDSYDKVKSGWVNDLEEIQELVYVLKGYSGLTSQAQKGLSELAIFIQNLKNNKVIAVDEEGDVSTLESKIPVEAKEKLLQITREEIFYFGQGVDVGNDKFGNNPSGVSLKFLYALLDTKTNTLARKMIEALDAFMYFVSMFLLLKDKIKLDPQSVVYVFNKAMIFNEKEKVEQLNGDATISEQTKLENHPLVADVVEEQARLANERQAAIEDSRLQLGMNEPDPNEPDPNEPE